MTLSREVIARYPKEPWGYAGLAFALRTQLRVGWADNMEATLKKAIESAETAVRLGPENYVSHFALARVRSHQGNQLACTMVKNIDGSRNWTLPWCHILWCFSWIFCPTFCNQLVGNFQILWNWFLCSHINSPSRGKSLI